jgi:hypothetical protein
MPTIQERGTREDGETQMVRDFDIFENRKGKKNE